MASKRGNKTEDGTDGGPGILGLLFSKAVELFSAGGQVFSSFTQAAQRRAAAFAARLSLLFLLQLWVSAGVFLVLLGLFFLLIDFAGIPRGLVFSIGGALLGLVSLLLLKFAKDYAESTIS